VGDGDPSKPEYSHIPRIPVPQGDKSVLIKEVKLFKEAFKKIIERDWTTSTWEDDYWLIKHPFGTQRKLSL
jgi:hypothetical protein